MDAMSGFPQTPWYTGLNAPVGETYDLSDLEITGTIPAEVAGSFFRATPDPAYPPFLEDSAAALSGDGMISALRIDGGKASFAMRYVQTTRYQAEAAAGEALFGIYRNPFTDKPEVAGVDRTVANTTPVWHAGKLLMTKEDGRPYRIDPATLETLGSYDFGGKLKSETMTAHVRVDAATGEMFFFGYEADGLASTRIAYCIADRDGNLTSEQHFDAPYCSMMHDFTITENYALFPVYPTTCDFDRLKAGGVHWAHEQERESWLGVIPRYGDVSEIRWFKGPKGVHCFHMMNAWEDGTGNIHFDQCLTRTNAFPFIREAGGIHLPQWELQGALTRWTVQYEGGADEVTEAQIGPPGDFPVIPAARQGRPYDHAWMLSMNPEMQGPPLLGGPVMAMFNLLLRVDMNGGPPQALALPPGAGFNEPVHIPSSAAGHEGWLLCFVDCQTGPDEFKHEAWIIAAGDVAAGAIAKIAIPRRQRPQIHGWWVGQAALDAAA
jgi:carotenoid cleavage dioxygenase-like enzyme